MKRGQKQGPRRGGARPLQSLPVCRFTRAAQRGVLWAVAKGVGLTTAANREWSKYFHHRGNVWLEGEERRGGHREEQWKTPGRWGHWFFNHIWIWPIHPTWGSSGDTKVKALQVAVKKKSDSEDNGQIELETNNLANAPIKRGSNNNQQVQLKADDFGTAPSSSGSGTQDGTPTPWTPWLTTEQIHNDPAKFVASILILYDAPYARNRTVIDRVDHLDPKVMVDNYC